MDTVLWFCPSLFTETLKWLSSLPILMQKSFWWWQCSDRYIISLSPHLHTLFPLLPVPNKPYGLCLLTYCLVFRVLELCESRGGRPGLPVLMSLTVFVDVKQHWTMLRHWSQFVPNMSTDIRRHEALHHHHLPCTKVQAISRGGRWAGLSRRS